jgi:hypothetical protein
MIALTGKEPFAASVDFGRNALAACFGASGAGVRVVK